MEREEQELGYIITAIFLCQALLSLNKKCLFLSWEKACDPSAVALKQASFSSHTARLHGLNKPRITGISNIGVPNKPGAAHCGLEVLNSGDNPSSQGLHSNGCHSAPREKKGQLMLSTPLDNASFLMNFQSSNISHKQKRKSHSVFIFNSLMSAWWKEL